MITNDFGLGQRVKLRKPHACGANEWVITRVGADVKLACTACGRTVMLDRGDFMRAAVRLWGDKTQDANIETDGNDMRHFPGNNHTEDSNE